MSRTSPGPAAAGVPCVSVSPILFKHAAPGFDDASAGRTFPWPQPPLVSAIGLYAVATALWLLGPGRGRHVVVYPAMAASRVVVPMLAWRWLREQPRTRTRIGSALVLAGVAIAAR